MKVTVRGAGLISEQLKRAGRANADGSVDVTLPDGAYIAALLKQLKLPDDRGYLVSVNNTMVSASQFGEHALASGDDVMVMPPLKGG